MMAPLGRLYGTNGERGTHAVDVDRATPRRKAAGAPWDARDTSASLIRWTHLVTFGTLPWPHKVRLRTGGPDGSAGHGIGGVMLSTRARRRWVP